MYIPTVENCLVPATCLMNAIFMSIYARLLKG